MLTHSWKLAAFSSALAPMAPAALSGAAASEADFYRGKTVVVQVPPGSSGTYHVYCQIVTAHIDKYIPGKPRVIIQNRPRGGGAKSASYMKNAAPKDGTYIAVIAPGAITAPLMRKLRFDARKFQWLGSLAARGNGIAVWHTQPFKTLDDLKKKEILLATSGFSWAGSVMPLLTNAVLGAKIKLVYGYKGGGAINLSVERGETQGRWNFYSGFTGVRPEWIKKKKIRFVIQYGPRNPALEGVPNLADILKPGSIEKKMYDVMALNLNVGQGFYVPPGVPAARAAALRNAFNDMPADPATRVDVEKRRIEWSPKFAAEIEAEINRGFKAATPEVLTRLRKVLVKKGKT